MKIYKHRHTKHPYITPQVIFEELEVDGVLQQAKSIQGTGPDGNSDTGGGSQTTDGPNPLNPFPGFPGFTPPGAKEGEIDFCLDEIDF